MLLFKFLFRNVPIAIALLLPAACAVMPSAAPTSAELLTNSASDPSGVKFEVIDIDEDVIRHAGLSAVETLAGRFSSPGTPSAAVVGVGDVLQISIFESALGGLFTAPETSMGAGSKNVTLPQVVVDASGHVRVPFAETVRASGRTLRDIEKAIEQKLKGRAIDPQVVVTLATNRSAMVTVSGEAKAPARLPVGVANEKILDMIAQAGGSSAPPHETNVTLVRNGQRASANLKNIFDNPRENVFVRPGDSIILQKSPFVVIALGAASRNAELRFETNRVTLGQAITQAGGLNDARADTAGVYVFRFERADVIGKLRPGREGVSDARGVPTIYRLNLRVAGGYFLAQSFAMRSQDLIFVANTDSAQLLKMFQLVGSVISPMNTLAATASRY